MGVDQLRKRFGYFAFLDEAKGKSRKMIEVQNSISIRIREKE